MDGAVAGLKNNYPFQLTALSLSKMKTHLLTKHPEIMDVQFTNKLYPQRRATQQPHFSTLFSQGFALWHNNEPIININMHFSTKSPPHCAGLFRHFENNSMAKTPCICQICLDSEKSRTILNNFIIISLENIHVL